MITIMKPDWEPVGTLPEAVSVLSHLERCGRTCYKSEDRITNDSAERFVRMICRNGHESVLEHQSLSVRITCSRACSHQIVRHRIGVAYSQESQRYCNYGKKGYKAICPDTVGLSEGNYYLDTGWRMNKCLVDNGTFWLNNLNRAFMSYSEALNKYKPEDARFLLPNACATEIAMTANLRAWRHIFKERALNDHAQWEIRSIFKSMLNHFVIYLPSVFGDLE